MVLADIHFRWTVELERRNRLRGAARVGGAVDRGVLRRHAHYRRRVRCVLEFGFVVVLTFVVLQ